MAEEATETAAETKAEATRGDQQAIRKLAQQQAVNNTQSSQAPVDIINSARGRVDTTA